MSYEKLKSELTGFYYNHLKESRRPGYRHPFNQILDEKAALNPGWNAYQLKAMQYDILADRFDPVIFKNSPFYFEMGTREAQCDGAPGISHPGGWLLERNLHLFEDNSSEDWRDFHEQLKQRMYLVCGPYVDLDHHGFPMSNVIENGLEGIYRQAEKALATCAPAEETDFVECAMRGLLAVRKISERFAQKAEKLLPGTTDTQQRKNLKMIIESAGRSPWKKPRSFYEGLNALWFLRDVTASIEGIGQNTFGRPDKTLYQLYRQDIDSGWMTKAEAYDLICQFLLIADCHDNKDKIMIGYSDHEYELSLTLGGCDENGREICNELTLLFLQAHHDLGLIYPKIKCRFGSQSSPEYLTAVNRDILNGRSVVLLINDDCMIPALVKSGKSIEDARNYLCSGCWDVTVEGCEKVPCGEYVSMARVLEMTVHNCTQDMQQMQLHFKNIDDAETFEDVYRRVTDNILELLRVKCGLVERNGKIWPAVNPSPFFSACMKDCLKNRKDYTAGGGRYNPGSMYLVGFANVVDSLLSIKHLCFDQKVCTLSMLLTAVRKNWSGCEPLRSMALLSPHFGDDTAESTAVAQRLHDEIYEKTRGFVNERGGSFNMGYLVYTEFRFWGEKMLATPDGRFAGDYLAHGIAPSRYKKNDITTTTNAVSRLDFTKCAANSVINIVLPAKKMSLDLLRGYETAFARLGLQTLHINCFNREELLDAQKHPEKHQDLVVRVCGFSARFVSLSTEWQNEFISRNFYD